MKKVINARITVRPEEINQFIFFARFVIEQSNRELGCLVYKLYQEVGNPTNFIFYEEYENQYAFDFHKSTKHFKTFTGQITDLLVESPMIEVF